MFRDAPLLKLRLVLDVSYIPNGAGKQALLDRLTNMVQYCTGNGMLTGDTDAEVATHSVTTLESVPGEEYLLRLGDDFEPEDGDKMGAILSALDHFEIPAGVVEKPAYLRTDLM